MSLAIANSNKRLTEYFGNPIEKTLLLRDHTMRPFLQKTQLWKLVLAQLVPSIRVISSFNGKKEGKTGLPLKWPLLMSWE